MDISRGPGGDRRGRLALPLNRVYFARFSRPIYINQSINALGAVGVFFSVVALQYSTLHVVYGLLCLSQSVSWRGGGGEGEAFTLPQVSRGAERYVSR